MKKQNMILTLTACLGSILISMAVWLTVIAAVAHAASAESFFQPEPTRHLPEYTGSSWPR